MINFAPAETAKTNALFAASLRANKLLYRSYRIVTLCKTMLHRYVEKNDRLGYFIIVFFQVPHERSILKHQTRLLWPDHTNELKY